RQHSPSELIIRYVSLNKSVMSARDDVLEAQRVATYTFVVNIRHPDVASSFQDIADEVASDESETTCDNHILHVWRHLLTRIIVVLSCFSCTTLTLKSLYERGTIC